MISITFSVEATAQSHKLCGTYMPYDTLGLSSAEIPDGYQVCLINHVTRHGSRYPVSDKENQWLIKLLEAQQHDANLTDTGTALLELLLKQNRLYAGKWGTLTDVGAAQQRGIAQRLFRGYGSEVFKTLSVWVDSKERCQQSCEAFLDQLATLCPECIDDKALTVLPRQNSLLNFFETNVDYLEFKNHGAWALQLKAFKEHLLKDNKLIDRYIVNSSTITQSQRSEFLLNLYNTIAIAPDIPLPNFLTPTIDEESMRLGWLVQNAHQYMEKGPYGGFGQLQVNISKPLLQDFITTTDKALVSSVPLSILRFAHAETIIPFAALLGIPEASQTTASAQDIATIWKDYQVSPMAANIVWVFCKDATNHYLVKMMLNERDVAFPLETTRYPWYSWDDVRHYYLQLLNQ